ncbi:HIT-like domain-containing protein [Syncephalis fuscata]|nr:HIT-like domain-containing protein [Syncephalis fuscata]
MNASKRLATESRDSFGSSKASAFVVGKAKKAMSWRDALLPFCRDPQRFPEQACWWDDELVVIKDCYPKSCHHWLVMPRQPLGTLAELKQEHLALLSHMMERGRIIAEAAIGEHAYDMDADHASTGANDAARYGSMCYRMGFHAIPSLRPLHMHVISQDFCSPSLKKKIHYNSFTTEFFLPARRMLDLLKNDGEIKMVELDQAKPWLSKQLCCHQCRCQLNNMPSLRAHLQLHNKNKI